MCEQRHRPGLHDLRPYVLVVWSIFLSIYWGLGLPLGVQANYVYPAP